MTGCDLVKVKPKENNPERNCKNELSIQLQNEGVDESKTMDKDGGYGWIIVAASFSVHMIADGILNSMGTFEEKIRSEFKENETVTSLVPAVASGMALCAGPIASFFVKKYGCRAVTIVGSILAAVSLFVSYFASNVPTLIVTVGIGFGTALSLVFVPAIVIVTTYFEKSRSLATGIAVSGAGVGTLAFAILIKQLIGNYGWDNTCLILSAVVLIIFMACGLLFKPLNASPQQIHFTELSDRYQRDERNEIELRENPNQLRVKSQRSSSRWLRENESKFSYQRSVSSRSTEKTPSVVAVEAKNYGTLQQINGNEEIKPTNIYCGCILADKLRSTIDLMNFQLLKDPLFLLFVVSNFCANIAFYIPIFCIPQHLKEDGNQIVSIYGIVNGVGRIAVGYIADKAFVNRLWVFNFSLVICGIACAGVVACNHFSEYAICFTVLGFAIAAYVTLRSVILVDLFGLEKLESSFGLLLLFEGLATFIGHPIAGLLRNTYGSYLPGFWFAAALFIFSGLILFPLPKFQKYIKMKQLHSGANHIDSISAT